MTDRRWVMVLLCVTVLAIPACNTHKPPSFYEQAQDREGVSTRMADFRTPMIGNAIAHDMSIADIHFVPHTKDLSSTGVVRLDRMVPHLNTYGGVVRYETTSTTAKLVDDRIAHVIDYLAMVGCDMEHVEVESSLSGGRRTMATEVIESSERAMGATAQADSSGQGAGAQSMLGGASSGG